MTMREQQEKEIASIKERTFELRLSDEDVKRLWEKAGRVGMTAGELLTSFVGDLVDGTYSHGSDERMYAEQWFDRCGFSYMADKTFMRYLLEYGELDSLLQSVETLAGYAEEKKSLEAELQDESYPWNDILITSKDHPQGVKCYITRTILARVRCIGNKTKSPLPVTVVGFYLFFKIVVFVMVLIGGGGAAAPVTLGLCCGHALFHRELFLFRHQLRRKISFFFLCLLYL